MSDLLPKLREAGERGGSPEADLCKFASDELARAYQQEAEARERFNTLCNDLHALLTKARGFP